MYEVNTFCKYCMRNFNRDFYTARPRRDLFSLKKKFGELKNEARCKQFKALRLFPYHRVAQNGGEGLQVRAKHGFCPKGVYFA